MYGYRYITGERQERRLRGASVCVQKGEKEGHILYLWVFAATVLSRRRLAAEELTDVPLRPPAPFDTSDTSFCPAPVAGIPAISVSVCRVRGARTRNRRPDHVSSPGAIPYSVPTMICSRLAPRSRWISFIGVRVCPTSIYRRGVSCTGGTANTIRDTA